ncbi:GNAT family N-acetyltransferase [Piscinibacter sp.]|uniref:GNAT family N-acetyltransferase n=1 Tax=Piscinibacter sp. TaxID=1903157 RepID=UPI0039E2562A
MDSALRAVENPDLRLVRLTLADASPQTMQDEAAAVFELFLRREAEFGVHPSVVIDHPDISDRSDKGFIGDAARYVAARSDALAAEGRAPDRIVVLTTFGDLVGPSLAAAGFESTVIDMPAGPDHTCAYIRGPAMPAGTGSTLYVEAVNEADEKIKPAFALKLVDGQGQLHGGVCGSIHERGGRRYAYLATLTTAAEAAQGTGTFLAEELFRFLRDQGVSTVHLGTQTAAAFYRKLGFRVVHRLVPGMRTRMVGGREVRDDLVMLAMDL